MVGKKKAQETYRIVNTGKYERIINNIKFKHCSVSVIIFHGSGSKFSSLVTRYEGFIVLDQHRDLNLLIILHGTRILTAMINRVRTVPGILQETVKNYGTRYRSNKISEKKNILRRSEDKASPDPSR